MRVSRVRRRDFSRHWAFTPQARRLAVALRRAAEWPARIPAPLFALLLGLIAAAGARTRWAWAVSLWLVMLSDWAMVALLRRRGVSFGPPQPNTLCFALPRALVAVLPLPLPIALSLQAAGSLLALHALWIEPHRIGTTRETLRSARLRPGAPIRVMHLGDLHVERITDRERRLVELVAAERPDLIVCSGDLLNYSYAEDREAWDACRWIFERLTAPLGTYVVAGSFPADRDESVAYVVAGTPARWLRDERVTLDHRGQVIDLIGLHCTHRPFLERPRLDALVPASRDRFTLLLYHTPDMAPDAAELGIDWMLSGHTHGGQVRLPGFGALATSSLYGKAFEMGRYTLEDLTLNVTRGIGLEGSAAPGCGSCARPKSSCGRSTARRDEPGDAQGSSSHRSRRPSIKCGLRFQKTTVIAAAASALPPRTDQGLRRAKRSAPEAQSTAKNASCRTANDTVMATPTVGAWRSRLSSQPTAAPIPTHPTTSSSTPVAASRGAATRPPVDSVALPSTMAGIHARVVGSLPTARSRTVHQATSTRAAPRPAIAPSSNPSRMEVTAGGPSVMSGPPVIGRFPRRAANPSHPVPPPEARRTRCAPGSRA